MMNMRRSDVVSAPTKRRKQRGVAAVEFALIASILFTVLIGIMEFGRVLFYFNTATEATRLGARLAVVCNKDVPAIKTKMNEMLNILTPDTINVTYEPGGCDVSTCRSVTVSIINFPIATFIPYVPLNIQMPTFSTTLPRESMDSANPDCS